MSKIKFHILFEFVDGPFGGGNQFLKALRRTLGEMDSYSDDVDGADVVLFNSNPSGFRKRISILKRFKEKFPYKPIVNRIDGPISRVRGTNALVDNVIYKLDEFFFDATIFQSKWSQKANYADGLKTNFYNESILNAPDSQFFYKKPESMLSSNRKVRLIATSWSANIRKGYLAYEWLDKNLDFDRYEFTFIGNGSATFKNIKVLTPVDSYTLGHFLRDHDIFITASQRDPCSNSLIEGLHCGLPAIALNDGGHPEIIKSAGELFDSYWEIPALLEKICACYGSYCMKIDLPSIHDVAQRYLDVGQRIIDDVRTRKYSVKHWSFKKELLIRCSLVNYFLCAKFKSSF